ncbi:5-formyltetrahydrofolate cyclo-ligase [Tsuneonella sp. YG55]|uniref:5-formyltetrahydrofolate cyclo-ligase n=1 Tax=Tsuneonella litorea TaxID=2976475 RepID=A0A9X2VZI1_9SPHN|nr:5-formyltetrahydrofolate cyclo-ligase [Tsuneonella litorea]MCT2558128.1 5-formyltetrahydrofolate cyclo-ligase [Tsuneonella litorea]
MTQESQTKAQLRGRLRAERIAHAAALPDQVRALVFHRPPRPVLELVPPGAAIGLYHAMPGEAPAGGYARYFAEQGHTLALPWFADRMAPMGFRRFADPFGESSLDEGPFGIQPAANCDEVVPDVLFVPLVAFTLDGHRLGQGGGHYDRWLERHPAAKAIGLAWDIQEVCSIPHEPHDRRLDAVITPTRLIGPFA